MLNRFRSEVGATAVLTAASMLLLMGMAALVVDYGLGQSERRLDQNVADAAVMGGAIETLINADAIAGTNEIFRLVDANLDRTITTAEWEACVDPDQLDFLPITNNECISYETGPDSWTLRVRVPGQDTDTTFGKVLGVDTLTTDAFAEATVELLEGRDLLPFGLFAGTGSGTEACLKDTSGGSLPAPCDGPTTGQFGPFSAHKFAPGPGFCDATNNVFVYSLGLGLDHPLGTFGNYTPGDSEIIEDCAMGNVPPLGSPNTVNQDTGNKIPLLRRGLLQGDTLFGTTFNGLLADSGSGSIIREGGSLPDVEVNNEPIWDWFISGNACDVAVTAQPDADTKKIAALACIVAWSPGDAAIFRAGLLDAQRLAFVPIYDESAPLPSGLYHINELVPVYLETLYLKQGSIYNNHSPGSPAATFEGNLSALTSIVLECDMLTDEPCPNPSAGDPFTGDLSTLKLSR